MKTIIDFSAFSLPGQLVLTTDTFNPVSIAIRSLDTGVHDGVLEGIEAIMAVKVPSHVFITYTENDLIMGMELTYPKINKFNITEYTHSYLGDHIIAVARPPLRWDDYGLQQEILNWEKEQYKKDTAYNVLGLFKFLDHDIPNEKNKLYCAQFASLFLKFLSDFTGMFIVPSTWKVGTPDWMVSPVQLLRWFKLQNWLLNKWTEQVPDDDNPQSEIIAPVGSDF